MAYAGQAPAGGGDIDMGQLWRALKRRSAWILIPVLIAFGATSFFVNTATSRYTADARILLQTGDSYYTRPGNGGERDATIDEREVASQALLITSRDLAKRAIERLQLRGDPEFDRGATVLGSASRLLAYIGVVRPSENEQLIDAFLERVTAFPAGLSRVLTVEFTSKDPELAARGANAIAEIYLELQEEAKQKVARSASAWLNGAIDPLRQKVADAEAKVEAFRAKTGLLVSTNNATIQQQQLAELNTQLNTVRVAQADAEAKAKLLREAIASNRTLEVSDVANNELVRKLVGERTTLKAQLAMESRSLLPGHPRIKELAAQLANFDGQIAAATEKAVRTLENDAKIAAGRVESLMVTLNGYKQQSITASENDVQLRSLEREARSQREQLEAMLTRYREATARDVKDAVPPDARIVQRADPPVVPSFPKKLPTIIIVTLATFLVSTMCIVSSELMSGRAIANEPAAPAAPAGAPAMPAPVAVQPALARVGEPPVNWMREAPARRTERVAEDPVLRGADPEPFPAPKAAPAPGVRPSALADRIRDMAASGGPVRCVVASAGPQPSRDVAFALGRILARTHRIVLVDAESAGGHDGAGFCELVAGRASFMQVIHRDPGSRLHLVSAGDGALEDAPDRAQGIGLALGALGQTYDVVLVAAPPITAGSERREAMLELLDHADLCAAVVSGERDAPAASEFVAEIGRKGLPVVQIAHQRLEGVAA
ncbi:exopolysaccharide transport family protein [Alsobacter sp. KACC 23698]|uniref:Exopolysaccharide transport family protein n=1 Tax=Alsobacter sp. KACC 23698 TaxID=3149229 RepID=A0AAU7JM36_9HYPH